MADGLQEEGKPGSVLYTHTHICISYKIFGEKILLKSCEMEETTSSLRCLSCIPY
jgi:hypothetical protein